MRLLILCLLLSLWPALSMAQDTPRIEVTQDTTDVIPGQPVVLRIKVLVPTWMSSPPVYPELEQPNLMVRLPERATTPVSEKIDGDTWSGTSRAYQLYPLAPGTFDISGKTLKITYAIPGSSEPQTESLMIDPIEITASIPDAAKDLTPFIAATGFTVEQSVDGHPDGELQVGDAITRTLTAKIDGTTPILIPNLLPRPEDGPLRAYADEPTVSETENRGTLSGTRTERVSYVAQTGGQAQLSEITLKWYDLDSKTIETITLPGAQVTVAEPPAPPKDPIELILQALAASVLALLAFVAWRWASPRIRAWRTARQIAWQKSEGFAALQVKDALKDRNLGTVYSTLDLWYGFHPDSVGWPETLSLRTELQHIGAARFENGSKEVENWLAAAKAFDILEKVAKTGQADVRHLPPLNPV